MKGIKSDESEEETLAVKIEGKGKGLYSLSSSLSIRFDDDNCTERWREERLDARRF